VASVAAKVAALEDAVARHGLAARCVGVIPLGISVADHGSAADAIVVAGRRAVAERGAEALVLACGPMGTTARALRDDVGVPVVEGVAFGALTAWALWRTGLETSKAGAYAWPERIPYAGMAAWR
jgi:allantoin racemase